MAKAQIVGSLDGADNLVSLLDIFGYETDKMLKYHIKNIADALDVIGYALDDGDIEVAQKALQDAQNAVCEMK